MMMEINWLTLKSLWKRPAKRRFASQDTSKEKFSLTSINGEEEISLLDGGSRAEVRPQDLWSFALSIWPFFALRWDKCRTGLENVLLGGIYSVCLVLWPPAFFGLAGSSRFPSKKYKLLCGEQRPPWHWTGSFLAPIANPWNPLHGPKLETLTWNTADHSRHALAVCAQSSWQHRSCQATAPAWTLGQQRSS